MDLVGLVRGKLTNLERMIMSALIVIEVHARDVTEGNLLNLVFARNWPGQLINVVGNFLQNL